MKITRKVRYGVNAAVELTLRYDGTCPVSLKEIAASQSIPEAYLEQLMNQLRRAGIVESSRGCGGGYTLARCPDTITVGEVMVALEGHVAPADCLLENAEQCPSGGCAGRIIWQRIYQSITDVVDSITLKQLADEFCCVRGKEIL